MSVVFTANYFFSVRRCFRQQRDTIDDRFRESQDQSNSVFRGDHKDRMYVYIFIGMNGHTCMSNIFVLYF
jgi:hypothetical protein